MPQPDMSPNMDPIWTIKDIPCRGPLDKHNGGDWTAAPLQGRAGLEKQDWEDWQRTGRLGVWYFRFLSEGKNVSTVPRIEASCNLPRFQASGRAHADKAHLLGPDRRSALRRLPPAGLRPDLERVKAQYMSLSLPKSPYDNWIPPRGPYPSIFANTRPFSQLLLRLWLSPVNNNCMTSPPPAPIGRSTARR